MDHTTSPEATMPDFQPDEIHDLEYGVHLRSVGVSGRADEVRPGPAAGRPVRDAAPGAWPDALADEGVPDDAAVILGAAVDEAEMRRELSLPVDDLTSSAAPGAGTRADEQRPHLEVTVDAPDEGEGQVLLEVDTTGVVRWHVPEVAETGRGTDRAGAVQIFRVPIEQVDVSAGPGDRGVLGFGVRKVLHLIRFPVQSAAALAGELAVAWWERWRCPYGLGLPTPDTFGEAINGDGVATSRLAELADKPFLLLIHGTFSRGRSAFHGLAQDTALLGELYRRYEGRVLLFDHPTLHVDPEANARWLLQRLPDDRPLTFDVVTHSRGGLVARQFLTEPLAGAAGRPAPVIRTLVHVATPNAGTTLASPDRLGSLLDAFTNLLSLLPDETVLVAVQGVLEVVKQIATGVVGGLDGLAAMDPGGARLRALNEMPAPPGTAVHAITSDFEPRNTSLAVKALDLLADPLFGTANDLVVPTEGVYRAGAYVVRDPFVVPSANAVAHTTFFRDAEVRNQLARWLGGS
jgi:hypothetical protein